MLLHTVTVVLFQVSSWYPWSIKRAFMQFSWFHYVKGYSYPSFHIAYAWNGEQDHTCALYPILDVCGFSALCEKGRVRAYDCCTCRLSTQLGILRDLLHRDPAHAQLYVYRHPFPATYPMHRCWEGGWQTRSISTFTLYCTKRGWGCMNNCWRWMQTMTAQDMARMRVCIFICIATTALGNMPQD